MTKNKMNPASLGFRVHTGWAAMIAVRPPSASLLPTILDRRRVEMIVGTDPQDRRFAYHAAAKLTVDAAQRFVLETEKIASSRAKDELAIAIRDLREGGYEVVASGTIVGNRPFSSPLEATLRSHSLLHAAEGELFRQAIIGASEALDVPVIRVPARELYPQAVKHLGVSIEIIRQRLAELGRSVGKPWTQDQKESLLVALLAFGKGDLAFSGHNQCSSRVYIDGLEV